jgi:hypothetical protein
MSLTVKRSKRSLLKSWVDEQLQNLQEKSKVETMSLLMAIFHVFLQRYPNNRVERGFNARN